MYEITRGFTGKLTATQRTSSRFSEEPLVLGKVLRRGASPIKLTEEQYQKAKPYLNLLVKAEAIKIRKLFPVGRSVEKSTNLSSRKPPITEITLTKDLLGRNEVAAILDEVNFSPIDSSIKPVETPVAQQPQQDKSKKNKKGEKEG